MDNFFRKLSHLKTDIDSYVRGWYRRVRYQWFTPYKLLTITSFKKGEYRDLDVIIFETIFQLLVNYVENEEAYVAKFAYVSQYKDYLKGKITHKELTSGAKQPVIEEYTKASLWNKIFNEKEWNSKLGMAGLTGTLLELQEWNARLKNNEKLSWPDEMECLHAQDAGKKDAEILRLYTWYKVERPNRPDPFTAFPEPIEMYLDENGEVTPDFVGKRTGSGSYKMNSFTKEYSDYLHKVGELEELYEQEDTEMAKRVVEIRRYLWT